MFTEDSFELDKGINNNEDFVDHEEYTSKSDINDKIEEDCETYLDYIMEDEEYEKHFNVEDIKNKKEDLKNIVKFFDSKGFFKMKKLHIATTHERDEWMEVHYYIYSQTKE